MSTFLIIELSSIILFTIYFYHAKRNFNLKFLFLALLYAFIFENLSLILFADVEGGYFYNENFLFFIHKTPLFIILLWSIILYSSYSIIKKIYHSSSFLFLVPLYVLALDIIMDIVAVQMGLWTWIGFETYNGFFSVPASNYIGWLLTSFFFVLTWEKLRNKGKLLFIQPFLAYSLFVLSILPLHLLKINFFDNNLWMQYLVFFLLVALFVVLFIFYFVIARRSSSDDVAIFVDNSKHDYALFIIRIFIYSFSFFGLIFLDLYKNIFISLVFFLVLYFEYIIARKYNLFSKQKTLN